MSNMRDRISALVGKKVIVMGDRIISMPDFDWGWYNEIIEVGDDYFICSHTPTKVIFEKQPDEYHLISSIKFILV